MTPLETRRWAADAAGVEAAAAVLGEGGLAAFPTETVYGLGARADDGRAVAAIFEAKGRPRFNPLITHVADLAAAERLVELTPAARLLARRFWPGPLTLVAPLRAGAGLSDLVTAGLATAAVRVPAHPAARRLLRAAGVPVAAPSANPSGKVSPTTADHVLDGLSGRIAGVLDDGPCAIGLESTILTFEGEQPVLLRPGGLPLEEIEACLGGAAQAALGRPGGVGGWVGDAGPPDPAPLAPGMLASHYAPGARLRLDAGAAAQGEARLDFGPEGEGAAAPPEAPPDPGMARASGPAPTAAPPRINLSPKGDLREAAAALFASLRALDAALGGEGVISVAPIPREGLGRAINDRLARAAAPR